MDSALDDFCARCTPPGENAGGAVAYSSLTGAADAFLALGAARRGLVLAITPGVPDADRLADDLETLAGALRGTDDYATRILEFPPRLTDDAAAVGTRLKTIAALRAWSLNPYPAVLVASYPALAAPIAAAGTGEPLVLAPGRISFAALTDHLAKNGYRHVPQVERIGDYAVRGGIVDAWSPGEEFPLRAEFFGEDLEGLRRFSAGSQVSIEKIDSAALLPASEKSETDEAERRTLLDLLPDGATVLALDHNAYSLAGLLTDAVRAKRLAFVYTGDPAPAGVPSATFATVALPGFAELGAGEAHHPELFESARARLARHLEAAKRRGDRVVAIDALSGGFECPATTQRPRALLVVTKADRAFTKRKLRQRSPAGAEGPRLDTFDDLEPGEYVVHVDHGVGRYIGSSEIVTDGRRTEVFTVEYADGAKLHVPAAHAHLLSRYVGVRGEAVRLHRLDGVRWQKDRAAAQKSVQDLAVSLLETQARRETVPGYAYDVACEGIDAFEAAFPYEETEDQTAAIAAIKRDLAATKPMDRLVCGDAGYGKTEVAMRAAYIAALNGRQVAVLAPTTVLAEQHFETFTARFDGTPVRIESLSRFQTARAHAGTFQRLATGACDIVIGTHALLSAKTVFRDLGLIVIDEEQRFGVRQKEFLKRLRATADILTLSATPIPRTLYLSMTGARDLSLLRTPPRTRVAVDTKVVTDSDEIVRAAISAELARGGQVFFLHNRVSTLGKVERRLRGLFTEKPGESVGGERPGDGQAPAPRIVVAHGQMDARTLARKMRDFERGEYDILLSTTIVESGIDIPRANTILVDHAETFGLADLYQLRGRVGRAAAEGHAVFLLPTGGLVDSDARERLKALQRHGGLGSGFNLAVRDLELRGAGNLLGAQQSGHIAAVGFGLYCQLLQRTIAALKGEKVREIVDVKLNLDFVSPRLPYDYIEEDALRLSLIRRFAEATDERVVQALAREMRDRFGPLPKEAETFVKIARLRVRCARAHYGILDVRGTRAIAYRANSREIAKVLALRGNTPDRKLRELLAATKATAER